jgi:fibronectin-binding autotransporter adhesin
MKPLILLLLACIPSVACSKYWVGGGSANTWSATTSTNWSATSNGSNNSPVPGSTDDVCFDGFSGSSTSVISANITVKSVTTTGYTGAITQNSGIDLFIEGSLTFTSGMTYTAAANSSIVEFLGTTSGQTINTGGQTLAEIAIEGTGSWTLAAPATLSANFIVGSGTFSTGNFNITTPGFDMTGTTTRSVSLGSSTIALNSSGSSIWNATTTTGLTFNAGTSSILVTDISGTGKTFVGGGLTYYNVTFSGGSGTDSITGANTFNVLTLTGVGGYVFPASVTNTVASFVAVGASGAVITITSSTSGTAALLSQATGTVCSNWLSLKDNTVNIGGAAWYQGANSTILTNVNHWTSGSCPGTFVSNPFIIVNDQQQ